MILMHLRRLGGLAATALLAPLALAACGPGAATGASGEQALQVLASFYPLQFVAEQVGGDLVDVENLTPPAADPHDLELSPARAREISTAGVVLYLSGFQPAVDEAITQRSPAVVVDAADHVTLLPASVTGGDAEHDHGDPDHAEEHAEEHEHAEDEHAHEELAGKDPHFWLDPLSLAQLAQPVADALAEADPDNADTYDEGAAALVERLEALDAEMAEALRPLAGATLITNHTAFGYLAHRYGLEQIGITGLDHDATPSPARLREIGALAREHGVTTLYSESLVSPRVVQTLASDLRLAMETLDTLEGLGQDALDAGDDYVVVMQRNLTKLTEGLHTP